VVDICLIARFDGGGDTSPFVDRFLGKELILPTATELSFIGFSSACRKVVWSEHDINTNAWALEMKLGDAWVALSTLRAGT
jgi:hypothetical protein